MTRVAKETTIDGQMAKNAYQKPAIVAAIVSIGALFAIMLKGRKMNDSENKRALVVSLARAEVGRTDPEPYWEKVFGSYPGRNYSWCGVFALWALNSAGITDARWQTGKGFIYPLTLKTTNYPEPGDVAYFDKNQHHAIVASVDDSNGTVELINGNGAGGAVSVSSAPMSSVTNFYSIQTLL